MKKSKNLVSIVEYPFTFNWKNDDELLAIITYPCVVTMHNNEKENKK